MPLSQGRVYTATRFLLELNGELAGSLSGVEGGEIYADVVTEPPAAGRVKKHLGTVRYAPITIAFGSGMGKGLFDWVAGSLAGQRPTRDGALIFLDYLSMETARLEFTGARISDIALPRYDAAVKDASRWEVVFHAEAAALSYASLGTYHPAPAVKGLQKPWLACNFSFSIGGLEAACAKVTKVGPIRVHQPPDIDAAPEVDSFEIVVSNADLQAFQAWHQDFVVVGHSADEFERSGKIVQLSPSLQEALCKIELLNVGIVRITPERLEDSAQVVSRWRVELYVEALELVTAVLTSLTPVPESAEEYDATSGRAGTQRAFRDADLADRLLSTPALPCMSEYGSPRRGEGVLAGEVWARTTA